MTHKMRTIFLSVYAFIILQGLNAEFVVGQVRFFWGNDTKFPTKDFDDSQWAESTLPMEKSFQNRKSTLWLRFEVQYNLDQWTETPNLELGKFDFPFEVYIDGIMVLKDGEAEGNYHYSIGTWELVPLERPLENEIKRHVIAIKVNKDGGRVIFPIIRSISNSRTSFIRTVLDVLNASIYQVLALLVAFIGFFFMVQYFFYRKNRTNLFFALMNFCFALYFIRIGSALEILPYLQTFAISKAALFGALAFVYFFFCNFFDIWNNKYIKRVISLISSVIIMGILFIPETLDMVNNFFSLALIPASIVLIGVLIMTFIAVFKKKQDSIILMIGSLIAVGFGIHDIYHQINEIQPLFWLQGLGIFGLNLSMFIAVAVRSMVTLRELENSHVAIRENNETLRRIDREKDNILANTSHELRTPLSGILGLSHELMEDDSLGMWHKRSLRLIHHSASRLKNLINDILDHSKLKNQDIHIALQKVDLVSILENVVRMVMPLTLSKKITWKMTIEKGLPFVLGDPLRLEQILFNLTGNAAKFTPQGMIETFAYTEEGRVQVGVRDTGMGISAENLSKIFDSFNQVDTSTEREFGGTGLGLSITRDLVRLHQSELKVKSQINQGSVFWFSLTAMEDLELGYVAASGDGSTRSNGNNAE
ncbi:MAG: sensor histidine kinase, partial [Spirochaetes bacterium]|nr:sensor histidine kinase [Spirochaetota bacterium]